jgi:hypothetical protein
MNTLKQICFKSLFEDDNFFKDFILKIKFGIFDDNNWIYKKKFKVDFVNEYFYEISFNIDKTFNHYINESEKILIIELYHKNILCNFIWVRSKICFKYFNIENIEDGDEIREVCSNNDIEEDELKSLDGCQEELHYYLSINGNDHLFQLKNIFDTNIDIRIDIDYSILNGSFAELVINDIIFNFYCN